ncbi:PQQ-dependent sugar dehydrogenase [Nocardioides anomalus]|uniref:PQQ-dependent sugar dehydrogenase n=1 Tax=Nocardioides anomalus TaxID=2712223 RepID=A0A6G6WIH7_9ACTN|nr:PQQ-dependent sugar dehydrogenase [Nocardioides anomalus]QIG45022.1 PQQ-dependent sugar dehydrogenase [Nocardioides anomalus]
MGLHTSRRGLLIGGAAVSLAACSSESDPGPTSTPNPAPSPSTAPASSAPPTPTPTPTPTASAAPRPRVAGEVATGLAVPWGVAFLPDGSALVGERDTGRLLRVTGSGLDTVATLDVRSRLDEGGETGLLGLALHPDFASNRLVYAYLSTDDDNRVVRATYDGRLGTPEPVLTGIATSTHHNGGGLAFGPDGWLYVSTGDAEDTGTAQDRASLNGKVLRVTDTGAPAPDNPFGNRTWSLGHRNVEGLRFDDQGRLWAAEFGDKGADELNLIRRGKDYGWPDVEGSDGAGGYADPVAQWPVDQCSPSGVAVAAGRAWLGALRGECLWSVVLDGPDAGRAERHLDGRYGRLRSVVAAPDGSLWVTTSNRDGRTTPREGDDRILRVSL